MVTYWERADLLALVGDRCLMYLLLSLVVSWVRCGTWLYRSLIVALFLISINSAFSKEDSVLAKLFVYQNKFISRNINIQGFICLLKNKCYVRNILSSLTTRSISSLRNGLPCIIIYSQLWQKSEIFAIPVSFWCWLFAIVVMFFFILFFTFFQPFIMSGKFVFRIEAMQESRLVLDLRPPLENISNYSHDL